MQERNDLVALGFFVRNDFFAENEIQIAELGEDGQGILVSFISRRQLSSVLYVCVLFFKSRVA